MQHLSGAFFFPVKCWISYARVKIQMFAETYVFLHVKYPLVSTDFKKNWECRTTLGERLPRSNQNICPLVEVLKLGH